MIHGMSVKDDVNWIDFLQSYAGPFRHIEFTVHDVEPEANIFDPDYLRQVKQLAACKKLSLSIHSLAGVNLGEKVKRIRQASIDIVYDALVAGEALGATWVTTHLGTAGFSNREITRKSTRLKLVVEVLQELLERTADAEVLIGLENLPRMSPDYDSCFLGDCYEEFEYIFQSVNSQRVGIVFDIGHARLFGQSPEQVLEFMRQMESRILGFHLHWNQGLSDDHYALDDSVTEDMKYLGQSNLFTMVPVVYESYSFAENYQSMQIFERIIKSNSKVVTLCEQKGI